MRTKKSAALRRLLKKKQFLYLPVAYDALGGRLLQKLGFDGVYTGGFVTGASRCTSEPLLTDVRLTPAQLNAGFLVNADIATTRFGGPAIESGEPPAGAIQWVWALSGGGAKGAFQLGAILFLARDLRYAPLGIAATSVGSMNALGAAERTTAGTIKLRATWLSLQTLDDMYELQPWVAHLDAIRLLRDQDLSIAEMMKGSRPRTLHPSERMVDDVDPLADISSTVGTIGDVGGALASPGGILVNAMVVTPLMMPLVAPAVIRMLCSSPSPRPRNAPLDTQ